MPTPEIDPKLPQDAGPDPMVALMAAQAAAEAAGLPDPELPEDGAPAPEPASGLPEQFKSVEDLAKAYAEQQKLLRTKAEPEPGSGLLPKIPRGGTEPKAPETDAKWEAVTDEYLATGTVTETTRKSLLDAGIPTNVVDNHLKGLKAQMALHQQRIFTEAGGEETFNELARWAGANLDEPRIKRIEALLQDFDDPTAVKDGIALMRDAYDRSADGQTRLEGRTTIRRKGLQNDTQALARLGLNDPAVAARFDADPHFRAEVMAEILEMEERKGRGA